MSGHENISPLVNTNAQKSPHSLAVMRGAQPKEDAAHKLTAEQLAYVDKYIIECRNVRAVAKHLQITEGEAAYLAGLPAIKEEIRRRYADVVMGRDECLAALSSLARGPVNAMEVTPDGYVRLNFEELKRCGEMGLIKELEYDDRGMPRVKFHGREKALEMIGKYHALFTDRVEVGVTHGIDPSVNRAVMAQALTNPATLEKLLALAAAVRDEGGMVVDAAATPAPAGGLGRLDGSTGGLGGAESVAPPLCADAPAPVPFVDAGVVVGDEGEAVT